MHIEYYMWGGWNPNILKSHFAEKYHDYWVEDHYEIYDEYEEIEDFYNDEIKFDTIHSIGPISYNYFY